MTPAPQVNYSTTAFWIKTFHLTIPQARYAIALVNTPIHMLPADIRGQVQNAMLYSLLDVMNGVPRIIADYVRVYLPEGAA